MIVKISGRKIGEKYVSIGVQGDNNVETVTFEMPRFYNGIDLSQGIAYVVFALQDGETGQISITGKDKEITNDTLRLNWIIGSEVTSVPGVIKLAIKISGLESELWHSETATWTIASTIQVESPQPVAFFSARIANPDNEPPITVSERTMIIPSVLQSIAVQNDQNSETVTIKCPRYFDGHDLFQYSFFLRTLNSEDGYDAVSLVPVDEGDVLSMEWTLKPPQTSYEGQLRIQLWVTGEDFDWQTAEANVNIIRQINGDPVVPITPSAFDELLKQVIEYANSAKGSEQAAANSATQAAQSESNAAASAGQAAASAESAKKSETSAADSLTDINQGLVSKLPITEANPLIKNVQMDSDNGIFTFTRYDGTTFNIDTSLEKVVTNFYLDESTNELVLVLDDGTEQRVSLSEFLNVYSGQDTSTVQMNVTSSMISAAIKGGSITPNLLHADLQNTINNKVTANQVGNASQITFADGDTMQEKLDSGELNGKDGVSVELSGMFYMRVNEFGHLLVGVADGAEKPPLSINSSGHLVYTID